MHQNALALFEKYATPLLGPGLDVLEAGIGKRWWLSPYLKTAKDRGWKSYHACDLMNFGSDQDWFLRQSGEYAIDATDGSFDAVVAQQILEHVARPWLWVKELSRILRPGGLLVLVAPITWDHHRNPKDIARYFPDGIRVLLEEAACVPVLIRMEHITDTPAERKCQMGNAPTRDVIGIGRKA